MAGRLGEASEDGTLGSGVDVPHAVRPYPGRDDRATGRQHETVDVGVLLLGANVDVYPVGLHEATARKRRMRSNGGESRTARSGTQNTRTIGVDPKYRLVARR